MEAVEREQGWMMSEEFERGWSGMIGRLRLL